MGFLDDTNDTVENNRGNELINSQIESNKAELEAKKQSLIQTRLDIAKSQGGQSWSPRLKDTTSLRGVRGKDAQAAEEEFGRLPFFF